MQRQAQNIRAYLAQHYKGSTATQEYADPRTMGEILDTQLDLAYRQYGVDGVDHVLMYNDYAEHIMSRLGAQIAHLHCGDRRVYEAIVTAKPPGESDIDRIGRWPTQGTTPRPHTCARFCKKQELIPKQSR